MSLKLSSAVFVALVAHIAHAQQPATGEHVHSAQPAPTTGVAKMPILIDGSRTPHLILDKVAITHFILSIAEHSKPTAIELERREMIHRRMGLSPDDAAKLSMACAVRDQIETVEAARKTGTEVDPRVFRAQIDALVTSVDATIRATLSRQGVDMYAAFIQNEVKPRIVVYGQ